MSENHEQAERDLTARFTAFRTAIDELAHNLDLLPADAVVSEWVMMLGFQRVAECGCVDAGHVLVAPHVQPLYVTAGLLDVGHRAVLNTGHTEYGRS